MEENLIPPFTLREAGLIVNECPKQHHPIGDATEEDHAIIDPGSGLLIPMDICSTFSYFVTRKPNNGDFADGVAVALSPMSAE